MTPLRTILFASHWLKTNRFVSHISCFVILNLCFSLRAQTPPLPTGAYQTAVVQKQATIQMQSAAASVVDTNEYWSPQFTVFSPIIDTNMTGTLLCCCTNKFIPVATFSFPKSAANITAYFTNSPLEYVTTFWFSVATNSSGASPMSNWLFTPTLQPTQLTLSWPQIGTVQLQQAATPKGVWSTYAWVTTNAVTMPIVDGNQFYRLLEPTNATPQTINFVASNPANTNGF